MSRTERPAPPERGGVENEAINFKKGITMKYVLLSAAMFALTLSAGVSTALAFSTQTSNTRLDTMSSARLADPDDLMDSMSDPQSFVTHLEPFGGGTLQFGESSAYGQSRAENRFVPNVGASVVPSKHFGW